MTSVKYFMILFCTAFTLSVAGEFPRHEFGGTGGWGSPVGFGLEYSRYLNQNFNVNGGVGVSMTGLKLSVGVKHIMFPTKRVSPFIGINFSSSSGINKLSLNVNEDTAKYKFNAAKIVTPRVGLKVKASFANVYFNAGYGIVTSGGGNKYVSGSANSKVADFADLVQSGGIEVSGTISFPIQ